MKRNFNNPDNFRVREDFKHPEPHLARANYPLDDRENELAGEINSPTIAALYNRTQTMENEEAPPRGRIADQRDEQPYKNRSDEHYPVGQTQETWDQPEAMTEENVRMKYVKMGVDNTDEPFSATIEPDGEYLKY